jgi:uncharacterized membrane protein YdbT with pleckstrin-like domain
MVFDRNHINLNSLQEGEHLIYVAHYHWWYMVQAFLNLILFSWLFGWGLYSFVDAMIEKAVTEVAITDRRVIFKRGWMTLRIDQVNIDRVMGCNVFQSALGRIFDFGQVRVIGTGIGEVDLPMLMNRPNDFRRALDEARDRHMSTIRPMQAGD